MCPGFCVFCSCTLISLHVEGTSDNIWPHTPLFNIFLHISGQQSYSYQYQYPNLLLYHSMLPQLWCSYIPLIHQSPPGDFSEKSANILVDSPDVAWACRKRRPRKTPRVRHHDPSTKNGEKRGVHPIVRHQFSGQIYVNVIYHHFNSHLSHHLTVVYRSNMYWTILIWCMELS